MSSGRREMQLSTQERALSTDVNRLQKFASFDQGEFFRYLLNTRANDDIDAGGAVVEAAGLESPLRAEVINGLLMRPQPGSVNLFVDPGVLYAIAPDTDPDASNYKFVRDPGVVLPGALVMTANGSGSPRIDVIECQTTNLVIEEDNRDFFDVVTGLFTTGTVTKATEGRLIYRVRVGTPGAGFPGTASGWLPLAVALVPDGATSNDNIVFWDVRPVVSDRIYGSSPLSLDRPRSTVGQQAFDMTAPAVARGFVEAHLGGRRIGGRLRSGNDGATATLTAEAQTVDFTNALNTESGFTPVNDTFQYVYLCTPFGLPRWARYTTGPLSRVPRSPRGIPILSTVAADTYGRPVTPIPMPASWGAGIVQTTEAVCITSTYYAGGTLQGGYENNGTYQQGYPLSNQVGSVAGANAQYLLVPGINYPAHATEILCTFSVVFTVTVAPGTLASANVRVDVFDDTGTFIMFSEYIGTDYVASGQTTSIGITKTVWVPIQSAYATTPPASRKIKLHLIPIGVTLSAIVANQVFVYGYKH